MNYPLVNTSGLPSVNNARLPVVYEAAKAAIAQCAQIDECKVWSDQMEALASYARQADDDALLNHAMRIKARAVERCGELLKEIPSGKPGPKLEEGALLQFGRTRAARDAGLSEHQRKTAIRVANVPKDEFEDLVEGDKPPTIEQLAERGKQRRPEPNVIDHLGGRNPADFEKATRLLGVLMFIDREGSGVDLAAASRGLSDSERSRAWFLLSQAKDWLNEVENAL